MSRIFLKLAAVCLLANVAATTVFAAETCFTRHRTRNDNNNLIMLDGLGEGNIKMMVSGMVGKDVDEQASGNIRFDQCGVLTDAVFDYRKNERNVLLKMLNHTTKVSDGWMTTYELSVMVDKNGQPTLATHKQGQINFSADKNGLITSASDAFVLNGQKGFTTTLYQYDQRQRLVKSVARGSDALANDQYVYHYDSQGRLESVSTSKGMTTYRYDKTGRELGSERLSTSSFSQKKKTEECKRFDQAGNCVLSYSHETEVFPSTVVNRHTSTAMQFEYW